MFFPLVTPISGLLDHKSWRSICSLPMLLSSSTACPSARMQRERDKQVNQDMKSPTKRQEANTSEGQLYLKKYKCVKPFNAASAFDDRSPTSTKPLQGTKVFLCLVINLPILACASHAIPAIPQRWSDTLKVSSAMRHFPVEFCWFFPKSSSSGAFGLTKMFLGDGFVSLDLKHLSSPRWTRDQRHSATTHNLHANHANHTSTRCVLVVSAYLPFRIFGSICAHCLVVIPSDLANFLSF